MTDRKLLEAAAKAAGIEHVTPMMIEWGQWNPLTDDGDAFRLAVRLGLEIGSSYLNPIYVNGDNWSVSEPIKNSDPYAATRRAIVRAAAEIGRE